MWNEATVRHPDQRGRHGRLLCATSVQPGLFYTWSEKELQIAKWLAAKFTVAAAYSSDLKVKIARELEQRLSLDCWDTGLNEMVTQLRVHGVEKLVEFDRNGGDFKALRPSYPLEDAPYKGLGARRTSRTC